MTTKDRIEAEAEVVSHPPRLELFARRQRLGWDYLYECVEAP